MALRLLLVLLLATQVASAQERIFVQVPAAYDPNAWAARQIRDQCGLANLVGNQVLAQMQKRLPQASAAPERVEGDARVVRLTILSIFGIGGGGWTGPKGLTVRAELARGGEILGFTERREESRGGILGPVTGTCGIFEGIAETLGGEISEWVVGLSAPQKKP